MISTSCISFNCFNLSICLYAGPGLKEQTLALFKSSFFPDHFSSTKTVGLSREQRENPDPWVFFVNNTAVVPDGSQLHFLKLKKNR